MRPSTDESRTEDTGPAAGHGWLESPVFVTGLAKSGTTLLLALLDGHPEILAYPDEPSFNILWMRRYLDSRHLVTDWLYGNPNQLHFGRTVWAKGLYPAGFHPISRSREPLPADWRPKLPERDELIRGIALRGLPPDPENDRFVAKYHAELDRRLRGDREMDPKEATLATVLALKAAYPRPINPRYWLFKQPQGRFREEDFASFFRHFPNGKIILIVRDPRGQFCSRKTREHVDSRGKLMRVLRPLARAASLEDDYFGFLALQDHYGRDHVFVLNYEELVSNTESVMRAVASFLRVSFSPVLLQPTKLGKPMHVHTATQPDGHVVFPGSATRWKTDLSHWEIALIEAATHDFLKRSPLGYEPMTPRASRTALRALLMPLLFLKRSPLDDEPMASRASRAVLRALLTPLLLAYRAANRAHDTGRFAQHLRAEQRRILKDRG